MDGHWTAGVIEGDILTWREGEIAGNTSRLTRTSRTECTLVTKKGTYEGRLQADGMLHWSDGDVWRRAHTDVPKSKHSEWIGCLFSLEGNPERRRLEREALERVREKEKEKEEEAKVYIGRPDLPPSWGGGGWGGPKEGHDKDGNYMLRGEARELPQHVYKSWQDSGRFKSIIEEKMAGRMKFFSAVAGSQSQSGSESETDSSSEEEKKKKKKAKKKKEKDKKSKKGKKPSNKKKGKKEKDKKGKKGGKKKRKNMAA